MIRCFVPVLTGLLCLLTSATLFSQNLELRKKDRICILGNTLADRMQHDGWLEAALHERFPEHELFIRNLGFSGDQLTQRLRSKSFGSPQDHLKHNRANVIFLMFGFNESFQGEAGLAKFKNDLTNEIKGHLSQKYDGENSPRLVVFSPIAHEDLNDPNLTNSDENNRRLQLYTQAAAEVAKQQNVPFVDLFSDTQLLYAAMDEPMTINGVHLNSDGNQFVARIICNRLFERSEYEKDQMDCVARIRDKVREKNVYWYNYYRATDGYSVYGGRSTLKFTEGQTNRDVMAREMEILDMMSANRDAPIWAAAQGKELAADDSNLPEFVPVVTNKPGTGPEGQHIFLSGKDAISKMRVSDGIQVELFADETMFPELVNPVQMSFDSQGRLWVATWGSYPHWKPNEKMADKLLILEDTDGDGLADKCTTFADGLHNPTGFEFYGDGVMLAHTPDVMYLEDTDGDDICDVRKRILHGIGSADTHHTANSFVFDPSGALHFQEGTFHRTQSETPYGLTWLLDGGTYRFEPKTFRFEAYYAKGFANPHGHVFDIWGRDIIHDGTGAVPFDGALASGKLPYPMKHAGPATVYDRRTRPCPATEWLFSSHFPKEFQGDLLVLNVIGDLGILRYEITDDGASIKGKELEPILLSDDPNFRPVDAEIAPDGSLYFVDWHNPIIGHMQHNLRDPSRDREHGRVYRVTYKDGPLNKPVLIEGQPIDALVSVLQNPEYRIRYRARLELYGRDSEKVAQAVKNALPRFRESGEPTQLLEALWMLQAHNIYDDSLLSELLEHSSPRVRAAATRVLCGMRDKATKMRERLVKLAQDENPRVRLEAIRTASFIPSQDAIAVVAAGAGQPTDKYLQYMLKESKRAITNEWKSSVVSSGLIEGLNQKSTDFILNELSNAEVLTLPMTEKVASHVIYRKGIEDSIRLGAIEKTSERSGKPVVDVLLDSLEKVQSATNDRTVVNDLVRLLSARTSSELASVRPRLSKMAVQSKLAVVRRIGYIGMILADKGAEEVWASAQKDVQSIQDFVSAIPLVPDQALQSKIYPIIDPLVDTMPDTIGEEAKAGQLARYVQISIPGKQKILTLAEVVIMAGGKNVGPRGKATQSSVSHGATADRAIDGNTNPIFSEGSQTHTVERSDSPWWEVDLGDDYEVETIEIFNRVEGNLGSRLNEFTLTVMDSDRVAIFEKTKIPAPKQSVSFEVSAVPASVKIKRAAIDAISYVRGHEAKAFNRLADLVVADKNRVEAIKSIQRIPTRFWNIEKADTLLKIIVDSLSEIPAERRTSPQAISAFQFAESLNSLLPTEAAEPFRERLGELGVLVVSIGTRPHRMSYDKETIVLPTGKQVQLVFENTDMMPHNLVITRPGTMEKVGLLAENTAQQRNAAKRHYVPNSKDVLFSGTLIQPQESETLSFQTPTKPGVYPYVCTYPGHWRRMYGKMIVVDSPREYLADPAGYLAANNIEIKDDVLKSNRTKTEWKTADFDNAFPKEFFEERNFETGKQMFTLSSCISCHKMGDEGYAFGPEFKELDPKWSAKEVLSHIIDPSKKIDDKYKTQTFLLLTGETVSGVVTFEDDDVVKIVENPLEAQKEIVINQDDIEDRSRSSVSIMPLGLLDTLTREEILDLLAYVMANGDKKHHLFKNGHSH